MWLRENVCMCPYVCCGRRAIWIRCACDRDIERYECANNHAWVRHRQMPIRCVYMREWSSILLVCVCVRERGASVTQQPSLLIRPSFAQSHVTHASTHTFVFYHCWNVLCTGIPSVIGCPVMEDCLRGSWAYNGLSWDTPAGYKLSRAVPAVMWQMGIC